MRIRSLLRFYRNFRAKHWVLALAAFLLVLGVAAISVRSLVAKDASAIHLAVAAPLTGARSASGKEMVQGIQLYLDSVNREGGINGHSLKLLPFNDQSDPDAALGQTRAIDNSPALVVLGHLSSPTSMATGPVYQALKIPAITGSATTDRITQANQYYFRTVFNDSAQGSMLALYAQQALKFKTASVIYSDDVLGETLDEAFETAFKRSGTIKHSWQVALKANNRQQSIRTIVDTLATDADPGILFLAIDDVVAKDFIVAIRRRGLKTTLLGNNTFARANFPKSFEQYEEEKQRPGYFLNGIYLTGSLIFDSGSADAQEFADLYTKTYGSLPTYVGAAYYDVARVAVQAIRAAEVQNQPASRKADRQRIRDQLKAINNRDVAFQGLTGLIYFDVINDAEPSIRIGQFVNSRIISAPIQLAPINSLVLVDLDREIKAGNIVQLAYQLKKQYLWRQRVVYTGIDINKLNRVDQNKSVLPIPLCYLA